MTTLYLGLALFFFAHFIPLFARPVRNRAAGVIGEMPYKGLFALVILSSLYLIITGWKAAAGAGMCYTPPAWGIHVTPLFVLVAFILFVATRAPTNIKRFIRNPQLTAVALWGIGHLFSNGETRSTALFGGFAAWALIAIWGSNRRDGEWKKPEKKPVIKDIIVLVIAIALYVGFISIHEWLFGVSPLPK
ncbi:NnrU family protein [Kordiimonas marina]|uniref:NnrU family protein n=1 Tax=Kordiimonas marina TaxID=2872312 RepID=UPI001FF0F88F|nr:NnrU family protein [Kordiimonas marina]MCJ9429575.1 NnrU family protein [Kordiimonas marina]